MRAQRPTSCGRDLGVSELGIVSGPAPLGSLEEMFPPFRHSDGGRRLPRTRWLDPGRRLRRVSARSRDIVLQRGFPDAERPSPKRPHTRSRGSRSDPRRLRSGKLVTPPGLTAKVLHLPLEEIYSFATVKDRRGGIGLAPGVVTVIAMFPGKITGSRAISRRRPLGGQTFASAAGERGQAGKSSWAGRSVQRSLAGVSPASRACGGPRGGAAVGTDAGRPRYRRKRAADGASISMAMMRIRPQHLRTQVNRPNPSQQICPGMPGRSGRPVRRRFRFRRIRGRDRDDEGSQARGRRQYAVAGIRRLEVPEVLRPFLMKLAQDNPPTDKIFGPKAGRYWVLRAVNRICKLAQVTIITAHGSGARMPASRCGRACRARRLRLRWATRTSA